MPAFRSLVSDGRITMKSTSLCHLAVMNDPAAPSPLLRSFERHLRALNRSGNTIQSYLDSARQAEAFLASRSRTATFHPLWQWPRRRNLRWSHASVGAESNGGVGIAWRRAATGGVGCAVDIIPCQVRGGGGWRRLPRGWRRRAWSGSAGSLTVIPPGPTAANQTALSGVPSQPELPKPYWSGLSGLAVIS
jgi:hypothetical protein